MDFRLAEPWRIIPLVLIVATSGALPTIPLTPGLQSQAQAEPHKADAIYPMSAYTLDIKILNLTFKDSLKDQNSQDYIDLRAKVTEMLNNAYGCPSCNTVSSYEGVSGMTFRNGSVIAESVLVFNTMAINADVVKFLFVESIEENPPAGLDVDVNYVIGQQVPTPTTLATTLQTFRTAHLLSTHAATSTRNVTTRSHLNLSSTKLSSDFTSNRAPLSHITTGINGSSTTLSRSSSGSITSHTSSERIMSVSTPPLHSTDFTNSITKIPGTTRMTVPTTAPSRKDTSSTPRYSTAKSTAGSQGSISGLTWSPVSHSNNPSNFTPIISTPHTGGLISQGPNITSAYTGNITEAYSEGHNIMNVTVSRNTSSSDNDSATVTHPIRESQTTGSEKGATAGSSSDGGGVPGWGIALLVLASVILLVLIVILILVLWRWCCHREEPGFVYVSGEPNPYAKVKQMPMGPDIMLREPSAENLDDPEKAKKNRTGFYVVNPE